MPSYKITFFSKFVQWPISVYYHDIFCCSIIIESNYLPIIVVSTKIDATGQVELSISQKSANFVVEN